MSNTQSFHLFQPKISVGIPTFNRPAGLKKTLESILTQSYSNLEIIISDNCSPSVEVFEVVSSFVNSDSRIKFFKQPKNMGAIFNFKFVLQKAQGDYFMWAADDDWWHPDFVQNILIAIEETPGSIAGFCNYSIVDEENPHKNYGNPLSFLGGFTQKNDFKRLSFFIDQFEGFGKSNIFYSIIKIDVIRNVPYDLICEKVPFGSDLTLIYSWLSEGRLAIVDQVLRQSTVGNVKEYSEFITEYDDRKWECWFFLVYLGKMVFYWNSWKDNLFFYFYLTKISKLSFLTKSLLFLVIAKKILFFVYDLICYTVIIRKFNFLKYFRRKDSLVQ